MTVELSVEEVAAICDALNWNVAKQSWLRRHGRATTNPAAMEGHKLRQRQAERVAERFDELLRGAG